jgi:poly(3-hydroxybutyrate) depolymerase
MRLRLSLLLAFVLLAVTARGQATAPVAAPAPAAAAPAPATDAPAGIPVGPAALTLDVGLPLQVFTYKPPTYRGGPLLVVFHGVARNAEEYRTFAITLAERFGAIVAAPLFDRGRFPTEAYQRGGIVRDGVPQPREAWTYQYVPRLVGALLALEGKPDLPYSFIGHSAGGQFLVRMTALAGTFGAREVVAANPGSHLWPTREAPYGHGFGGLPAEVADDETLRRYLAARLTLYLGTGDTDPNDDSLSRDAESMKQGPHRYARGLATWEFAQRVARERGWAFNWRKFEAPGIGHVAAEMFASPVAGQALYGEAR